MYTMFIESDCMCTNFDIFFPSLLAAAVWLAGCSIDFEYCSYNYRGFDIANHLLEWTYDYTAPEAPYYSEQAANYPTESQRLHFIENYLSETGSAQSAQSLLAEIRTYSLASHLFWGLWSIVNAGSSQITFGYWVSEPYI